MLDKWADTTCKSYLSGFLKFQAWASRFDEVTVLPVSPGHFCLYLVSLGQSGASTSVINSAMAAVSWAHRLSGFKSPTMNETVKLTADGLKHKLSKPRNSASPITPEHLYKMVVASNLNNLSDLRVLSIILLAFGGFMRFSEVVGIRTEHLKLFPTHVEIFLPTSKTDKFKQGQTLYIAFTGKSTCPVTMLLKYLEVAKFDTDVSGFLFKNVQHCKGIISINKADVQMKYSRVSEIVKGKFASIGLDTKAYHLHSLRAGGSSAAANHHLPDRAFQRHGRWRTTSVKNSYITESMSDLLSVSQNLGI
jgi:site-specific recombinase XerD